MLALIASPAAAQTVCLGNLAGINCTPGTGTAVDLTGQTVPLTITVPTLPAPVAAIVAETTGPVTVVADTLITSTLNGQPALELTSDADIFAQVTALSTTGVNAPGALLVAADDAVLIVDETVTTLGAASDGINITAGTIDVTVDEVTTLGVDADGIQLLALEGPAVLDVGTVITDGDDASAVIIDAAGNIAVEADVLQTGGDRALGLDLSTDAAVCATLGAGSCDVDAIVGNITTDGFGSVGALVTAAGDTDLAIDVLETNGDQAAGLNLSADPAACIALGVGACDTAFTVENLTTDGANAPGAIVNAVGDIDADIGVLTTGGEDAIGLNLASNPEACAILGAGGCETSFSVGQLTTEGDGAIGALVRAAGPTTADIDLLQTFGDGATGIDIAADPEACVTLGIGQCTTQLTADRITTAGDLAAGVLIVSPADVVANLGVVETAGLESPAVAITGDPEACVLLGTGACDTTLTADRIATTGLGSAGVLVNSPGQIVADLGVVNTDGNDSPAITLITDPAVCLLVGAGACGVTLGGDGTTGPGTPGTGSPGSNTPGTPGGTNVDTDGGNSPGVVIVSPGPIDADLGNVETDGANSPGVVIDGGEGRIEVTYDTIDTDGANSPGIDVSGTGRITIVGGAIDTNGINSPGVIVVGADDPVLISVGPVTTSGANSDGIDVTTTTGNQTILAGPITVTGAGSNGIDATATGCAELNIVAQGPITSAAGIGIDAQSACNVNVTTRANAPVTGAVAGINVVSGTGANVTIGANLASSAGPALNVDGAAANVVIQPTGTLNGRFDLTANNDRLTNNGTVVATAGSNFGAGTDALVNNGTIRATGGAVTFAGLEGTTNAGLIEMRDGVTDDVLTLPGTYNGTGAAALGVDVGTGTASDRLVIGGAATGSTAVLANGINGGFVNGAVIVDAGAGTSAAAFTLSPRTSGLVDYALAFNPANNDFAIFGTPSVTAVSLSLLAEGAREVFYRGNEAVAAHLGSSPGWSEEQPQVSRAFWFQGFGMVQDRERTLNATPFGQARSYDLDTRQDWFGGQMGVDLLGGPNSVIGVTGGYIGSNLRFDAAPLRFEYQAANVGAYGRFGFGGLNISGLIKYEHYWIDIVNRLGGGVQADSDGDGWGGFLEAGYRFGGPNFFVEPLASIEYANLNLDNFATNSVNFDFDEDEGLRGKAGVRFGAQVGNGPSRILAYGKVQAIHEFNGEDRLTLTNTGQQLDFDNDATDTYGRATVGVDVAMTSGVRGFIEGSADFAGDVDGGGARAGLSIRF